MDGDSMKIGELARRAGVATSAIRYYESVGLLPAPARASGQRRYDAGALDALRSIRALQRAGFTLEEIRALRGLAAVTPTSARWQAAAHAKLRELDASIRELRRARDVLRRSLACACDGDVDRCDLVRATEKTSPPASVRRRSPPTASPREE